MNCLQMSLTIVLFRKLCNDALLQALCQFGISAVHCISSLLKPLAYRALMFPRKPA